MPQNRLLTPLGLFLGDYMYIGRFLVLASYRSFFAARVEKQDIQTRLDQVLGEKERIFSKRPGIRSEAKQHTSAAQADKLFGSSFGYFKQLRH